MSVPSEVSSSSYTGNGATTVYPTGFTFLAASELRVRVAGVLKVLGVDYSVTMPAAVGDPGGVTFLVAPADAADITIERTVPLTQPTVLRNQGTFRPEVHEQALDESVFRDQQLDRRIKALESAGPVGSVIAGDGLQFAGSTLHVGAGPGLVALADTVAVDFAAGVVPVRADGGAVGTGTKAARDDHRHDVQVGNPATLHVGDTTSAGAATSLALSDHQHAVPVGTPVSVTKSASFQGVATTFAASDHKHDVATAAAIDLTDATNGEGNATTLARSNHTHAHGARGGGPLHATATTSEAGFLSAADKVKLDGLASETISTGEVKTNDNTPTVVLEWTPVDKTVEVVRLSVCGLKSGAVDAAGYTVDLTVRRFDGTTSIIGQTPLATHETNASWAITVAASSPKVVVTVTGVAATVINWKAQARRLAQLEYA